MNKEKNTIFIMLFDIYTKFLQNKSNYFIFK